MSKSELHIKIACYWWQKAEESLRSAERELAAGSFSFAVNRLYYAVFYAVSAALMGCYGKSYKKHSGVRAAFHREFVKQGLIGEDYGKLYDQLYDDRQEGDYELFIEFQKDYVEMQLKKCKGDRNMRRLIISTVGTSLLTNYVTRYLEQEKVVLFRDTANSRKEELELAQRNTIDAVAAEVESQPGRRMFKAPWPKFPFSFVNGAL